jgi:hypothetical protein
MSNGAPGNRNCTVDFKIRVIDKWIAENEGKGKDVRVGLGISIDEIHRARHRNIKEVRGFYKELVYPLLELNVSRSQCFKIIHTAGLPTPPRSSCFFCPFHSHADWIHLRNSRPDLFEQAVRLEEHINHKREVVLKKDKMWLHPALKPLAQAVGHQMTFNELENCAEGYCFV